MSVRWSLPFRIAAAASVACLVTPHLAQAQAPVLTLDAATAEAIAQSRLLKIAALEVAKADDEIAALRTRRLPRFDVGGLAGTLVAPLDFTFKQGVFGVFPGIGPVPGVDTRIRTDPSPVSALTLQLGQPLTQLRRIAIGETALGIGKQIAEEARRAEELSTIHNVQRLYYGLVQAQNGLRASARALELYRELDRTMSEYVSREVVLPSDALEAKAALARQEQADLALRNTMATLREQMNVLLGRDVGTEFTVTESLPDAGAEIDVAAAQARALEARPEVQEARLKVRQAEQDLKLKREEYIPEISVAFGYLGLYNFEILPRHGLAVGVVGTWEPWDWGRRRAEADAKARTVEQAKLGVLEAESRVKVDVSTNARKVEDARAMLRVTDLARQAAAEKLRVALEQFKVQATTERQVLEAQALDADAARQYQQALAEYWTARADFEKALGGR